MSDPVERELMPGVFVTDFRNSSSTAISAQANVAAATVAAESKSKEEDEQEDEADDTAALDDGAAAASSSSSSRSTAAVVRPPNAAFPIDIPNDVEELELELAALTKNMAQLLKSNEILLEELKQDPEEQIYVDAIAENRLTILRRSDRIIAIRQQIQLIAPHRVEAATASSTTAAVAAVIPEEAAAEPAPAAAEEGLFL